MKIFSIVKASLTPLEGMPKDTSDADWKQMHRKVIGHIK